MIHLDINLEEKGWTTVVVLNKDNYRSSIYALLQDESTYMKLPSNPTKTFQVTLGGLVQEEVSLGILSQNQADYILVENPVTPILHGLPRVHKGIIPPLMRPMVSGIMHLISSLYTLHKGPQ